MIKIGVLCPYSTIYPQLSKNLIDGLVAGLSKNVRSTVQIVPEFVRQGEPTAIKPAIEKLLGMDGVHLLTGVVNYKSIEEMLPTIERYKRTAIFCDHGEYLPPIGYTSNSVFFNSFDYWQLEFALGFWAQKEFGGRGSVFMPIYDGGYHMHTAFRYGVLMAENVPVEYAIPRFDRNPNYKVRDAMAEYMGKFKKERPTFIHSMFSGTEAQDLFEVYQEQKLHSEIPLIVAPHMSNVEILNDIRNLDMSFYSASSWSVDLDTPENKTFKSNYVALAGNQPNSFSLLGYEVGMVIDEVYPLLKNNDFDTTNQVLKEIKIKTPRGDRGFHKDTKYTTENINIEKIQLSNNLVKRMVIGQSRSLEYDHSVFGEIHNENVSGWLNPYLCV